MKYLKLILKEAVPSLNKILAMNPWKRESLKKRIQQELSSELLVSGRSFATQTTSAQNTKSMPSAIKESYEMIGSVISSLKLPKSK